MKELLNSAVNYAALKIKKIKKFFINTVKTFKEAFTGEEVVEADATSGVTATNSTPNPFDVMGNVCVDGINNTLNKFGKKFKNKKKADTAISKIVSTAARVLSIGLVGFFMINVIKAIIAILPVVINYTVMIFAICIIVKIILAVFNTAIGDEVKTETVNA